MKEKIDNEKKNRRKRERSMFTYEIGRRFLSFFPFSKRLQERKRNVRRQQLIFIWGALAIPILHFCVFWIYVNFDSLILAFRNIDYAAGGEEYWTLDNFKEIYRMFAEGGEGMNMMHYAGNTLKYWLLATAWSIPHSILLTYAFHKKLLGKKLFTVMIYIPSLINAVALTGIFRSFINANGAFGYLLRNVFGLDRVPNWFQEVEYANATLLFYSFFFGIAGSYVLYSGAMANVDQEISEAAYMDGVTMWQEILYIDIPLMWPTLSVTVITALTGIFGASGPILLFTPYMEETYTFGYWIFDQVRTYQQYYVPAALGLCFTAIAFPIMLLVKRWVNNMFTTE